MRFDNYQNLMPKHKLLLVILNNFLNSKSGIERYGWIGDYYWSQFYIDEALQLLSQIKDSVTFLQLLVNLYSRQVDNRHDRDLLKHIVFEVFVRLANQNSLFPPEGDYTEIHFHRMVMENKYCQEKFSWLMEIEDTIPAVPQPLQKEQKKTIKTKHYPVKVQIDSQAKQLICDEYQESIKQYTLHGHESTHQIVKYLQKILTSKAKIANLCAFFNLDRITFNERISYAAQNIIDINKVSISFKFVTNQYISKIQNEPQHSEQVFNFVLMKNTLKGGIFDKNTRIVSKPNDKNNDSMLPPIIFTVSRADDFQSSKQSYASELEVTIINDIVKDGHRIKRIVGQINLRVMQEDEEFWKLNPLIICTEL